MLSKSQNEGWHLKRQVSDSWLGGPVFFSICSSRRQQKSKIKPFPSRKTTMFTNWVCKSAITSDSPQRTLSQRSHSHFNHTSPCYSVSCWLTLVDTPLHCRLCPQRNGFPFLLTSSLAVPVRSQQHILSLCIKSHLFFTTVTNATVLTCGFCTALC